MKFIKTLLLTTLLLAITHSQIYNGLTESPITVSECDTESGEITLNGFCWPSAAAVTTCQNRLDSLDGDDLTEQNYTGIPSTFEGPASDKADGSVYSEVVERTSSDPTAAKIFDFLVAFSDEYNHDTANCVQHRIYFTNSDADEFDLPFVDTYDASTPSSVFYDATEQYFLFNILQTQVENPASLGCSAVTNLTSITWTCTVNLEITLGNTPQLTYTFNLVLTLELEQGAQATVSITQNKITGSCCSRNLTVSTILAFCENEACANSDASAATYYSEGIARKEDFWMVHYIDSTDFYSYKLDFKSISFGPFSITPSNTLQFVHQGRGAVKIKVSSSVAFDDLTAQVYSNLQSNDDRRRRRVLQQEDEKYADTVSSQTSISILDDEQEKNSNVNKKAIQSANIITFGLSLLVFAIFLC